MSGDTALMFIVFLATVGSLGLIGHAMLTNLRPKNPLYSESELAAMGYKALLQLIADGKLEVSSKEEKAKNDYLLTSDGDVLAIVEEKQKRDIGA